MNTSPKSSTTAKEADKENEPSSSGQNPTSPSSSSDIELPNSIVTRIIRESLPQGVIVSREARTAISKAASIFVLYATSSANNLVMEGKRKTLRDVDILSALEEMDFGDFIPKLKESLEAYKTCTKNKRMAANERKKQAQSEKMAAQNAANSEIANSSHHSLSNENPETSVSDLNTSQGEVEGQKSLDTEMG